MNRRTDRLGEARAFLDADRRGPATDVQKVEEARRGRRPTRDELAMLDAGLLARN
ncbi:hypothetical protein [Phenylobacterium zucineum]|uniref:hypothetical protein n=1 Tax=Phenylobacterium zucineum TaxID=284016 RepID=UPI0002E7DD71|nr:hypothetical protein [Phenylobacterium zucineum]